MIGMYVDRFVMDVFTLSNVCLLLYLVDVTLQKHTTDMWDGLTVRYNKWLPLPRTSREAANLGYNRTNDICKTNKRNKYHGFLYQYEDDTKALPIYDLNGRIAGVQAMIPGNMKGFDFLNNSISLPPTSVRPPILPAEVIDGIQMYTITAYFKHPELVCNPIARMGIQLGKGLYIQTGLDPLQDFKQIPMDSKDLGPEWTPGSKMPTMGLHYFLNLSKDLHCEKIYPVFLMYDTEGKLGAFGWSFQGDPMDVSESKLKWFKVTPPTYQFTFDVAKLPACMFNPAFEIFGIHIWLQHQHSPTMTYQMGPKPKPKPKGNPNETHINYNEQNMSLQTITSPTHIKATMRIDQEDKNYINNACVAQNSFLFCMFPVFIWVYLRWW